MANPTKHELLVAPYGGALVHLLASDQERAELRGTAVSSPSVTLTPRALCDLELLATGAFSPVDRFMGQADYASILDTMRLSDGTLFPMPITLSVADPSDLRIGMWVPLRSPKAELVAVMQVQEVYERDPVREAVQVCGTADPRHPLVAEMATWGSWNISGPLRVVQLPRHYDFCDLRQTPAQVRARLERLGFAHVVAFQTRNPLHRVHEEMTKRAAREIGGALLLHPVVGLTKPGDVDHYTRVRSIKAVVERYYEPACTVLSLLPLAMRMAGPREALWHAVIRRNYGANHFIVGRDHASPGLNSQGEPFYDPYEAQALMARHERELGVTMVPFKEFVYVPDLQTYEQVDRVPEGQRSWSVSGTAVRDDLDAGNGLPDWYIRPEAAAILASQVRPRHERGFCVWLTGLPCAGKSTIAEILSVLLLEHGRQVTLLDGDVVRTHLSKGLGFSREDRDTNILRIGYVAAEIVRHHGAVICAAVSPYRATRNQARSLVGHDRFILAYVDTPPDVCRQRDVKGMYAKAQRGEIKGFTGVDDPYEVPVGHELTLNTVTSAPEENAAVVLRFLIEKGLVHPEH